MNRSIPTGSALEFLELKPLNPLISKSVVKVLYEGRNRNKSCIFKSVADRMANTLPGTPIVGEYKYEAKDFGTHGESELVIDEAGLRFVKSTVPFGFVPLDAKVWWQEFTDNDGVNRNYLCTEAFLWTGRYPECQRTIDKGNGQSMELHQPSLVGEWSQVKGEWAKFENDDTEYFIINDAVFSALCILGENVEPCFEGANIGAPGKVNTAFSLDQDDFKKQMLDFMADLKDALNNIKIEGGQTVENENLIPEGVDEETTPIVDETTPVDTGVEGGEGSEGDFAKKKDEEDDKDKDKTPENKDCKDGEDSSDKTDDEDDDEDKKKKKKDKYNLEEVVEYQELLNKFNELQSQFSSIEADLASLKEENTRLAAFEANIQDKEKDAMINSFYMLSDEDKAEIIANKSEFSLEEIESKLSVICVRKKVNFDLDDTSKNEGKVEAPITTYSLEDSVSTTPAWLKAVENVARNRK